MPWAGGIMGVPHDGGGGQAGAGGHMEAGGAAMGMPWGQQGSCAEPPCAGMAGMAGGDSPAAGMWPAGILGADPPDYSEVSRQRPAHPAAGAAGIAPPWLGGAIAPPPAGIPPAGIPPAGAAPPAIGGSMAPPPSPEDY
ncbi:hypothetical protein PG994_005622 [Apiospora phragmitis]|uniref:Uncharacterized protein n=1 Tax=Apiospora phragmitis TaxID=2905665 RepID=A0ABR1VFB3_9PEZI